MDLKNPYIIRWWSLEPVSTAPQSKSLDYKLQIKAFRGFFLTKLPPLKISYRNYKKFTQEQFENKLSINLSEENDIDYDRFQHIFEYTLNSHVVNDEKRN